MEQEFAKQEVIGWLLAWLPEGGKNFNFEFFQETATYHCNLLGTEELSDFKDMTALQRASEELELLLSGKLKKYGQKVIDGYVLHVMGRRSP